MVKYEYLMILEVLNMSRLERLKMGKVLPQHLKQYNELLRYVFQVTNKELQQVGW